MIWSKWFEVTVMEASQKKFCDYDGKASMNPQDSELKAWMTYKI